MSLVVYQTIGDLYRALNLPIEPDMDFSIHFLPEIHPVVPFKSPVFRTEYFSFIFVKEGKGYYSTGGQTYPFESRTLYFTNPGHIKSFEVEASKDAYIIALSEKFLRENIHAEIYDEFSFLLAETVPPIVLGEAEFAELEETYLQIYREYQKASRFKHQILGSLFIVLLLKIKERYWSTYNPLEEGDRNSEIVRDFKQLLEDQFSSILKGENKEVFHAQDYAKALNLHPSYLGNVIKVKTGKTLSHWIAENMILTAKVLLRNSALSAKEIGYRLGYSEPTHFSRFFKKQTQQTPSQFKKSLKGV